MPKVIAFNACRRYKIALRIRTNNIERTAVRKRYRIAVYFCADKCARRAGTKVAANLYICSLYFA